MAEFRFEAHRGVGTEYPESTLPAFAAAVEQGYKLIELDPRFTADNQPVILHDKTVNRTARLDNGEPLAEPFPIAEMTLAQAKALDFGFWKHPKYKGTRIATLNEVLEFVAAQPIGLKFDNIHESFDEIQRELFYSALEQAKLGSKIGFTCKTPAVLGQIATRFPEAELHYDGALDEDSLKTVQAAAFGHRLTIWACYPNEGTAWFKGARATAELCDALHLYGEVGIWLLKTQNELADAVCNLRADCVETDGSVKPDMIFEL